MSKPKEKEAEASVLNYLVSQNRPYSVNDIAQNLHKELGKTAVQKALEKLVQDGKVREKAYGKQKVYLIDQTGLSEASPEELREMDVKVLDLEKRVKDQDANLKTVTSELKELNSSLTTEEAKAQLDVLTREVDQLRAKYKVLSENSSIVDSKTRDARHAKLRYYLKEWRGRKDMTFIILGPMVDESPLPKNLLFEDIGIETDEAAGTCYTTIMMNSTVNLNQLPHASS